MWCAWLDIDRDHGRRLADTLSGDERERARGFVDAREGDRWATSRGILRDVLGRSLDRSPGSIRLAYGPHGSPRLDAEPAPLHFNVSRSGPVALYAVGRASPVGVDVEEVRAGRDVMAIADGFFSSRERAELAGLPASARVPAFFRCWTRKEACLKALGVGLHAPLDGIEVTIGDGPAAVVRVDGRAAGARSWSLTHLVPREGWVGALAVEGPRPRVLRWRWAPSG